MPFDCSPLTMLCIESFRMELSNVENKSSRISMSRNVREAKKGSRIGRVECSNVLNVLNVRLDGVIAGE